MRILYFAISGSLSLRGVERYNQELLSALARIDDKTQYTVLVAPWQSYYSFKLPANFAVKTVRIPRSQLLRNIAQAILLHIILRSHRFDIVHIPNVFPLLTRQKRVIVTIHDLIERAHPESFGFLQAAWRRSNLRRLVRNAGRIIAISEFTHSNILSVTGEIDNIETIHNGYCRIANPKKKAEPSKGDYILMVAAHQSHKNISQAIDAFALLDKQTREKVRLKIVGSEGPETNRLGLLVEKYGLNNKVEFLERVSDALLAQLYSNARMFLFPSDAEGFGFPVLEAMDFGVPVVAANRGALPEVCGTAAIYVNPNDPQDIRRAIDQLLDNSQLCKELVKAGKQRIRKFSWTQTASRVKSIYETLYADVV